MPNPHPGRFLELLAATDGPVLDCGSGGRKLPGVVSLEYLHQGDADLLADGLALPFPDNTFTLALSQAVLEHVTDPQRYVDELVRVLRPGGLLWVEAAFMQPIHQAPTHYFNITPFGLAHLCRALDVVDTALLGRYEDVVRWMAHEANVRAPSQIPTPTSDRYFNVASGVALLGEEAVSDASLSVLIPYRPSCPERAAAFTYVSSLWAGFDVVIADAPGDFNRAPAVCAARRHAHGDVLIITDADVWCSTAGVAAAVAAVVDGAPWAIPHALLHRLDADTSARVLDGGQLEPLGYAQRPYRGHEAGTFLVIHRDVFDDVPPDPRFAGWGQEDDAWALALRILVGAPWRGDADLWHLWHPIPERRSRRVGNTDGEALWRRYRSAARAVPRMRELVDEAKGEH